MPCKLTPITDSFDFDGTAGQQVTLVAADHIGSVMFAKAQYAGDSLVPEGQAVSKISFTVASGANTLKMVFVFTASTNGVGELREDASPDSQFLRSLMGSEPFQALRIIGK
jgi:hypothetical protein